VRINDFFLSSMIANRHYSNNVEAMGRAAMRLSTGYRINSAADDPAGLAISEKMRAQIRGLNAASRNVQDAISLVQTAESEMASVNAILQRMSELAIQAATGTNAGFDRTQIAKEFEQLKREINDIANQGNFNNLPLFDNGSNASAATVGINASTGEEKLEDGTARAVTYIEIDPFRLKDGDIISISMHGEDGRLTKYEYEFRTGDMMRDIFEGLGMPADSAKRSGYTLTVYDGEAKAGFTPSAGRSQLNYINYRIQTGPVQGNILDINIPIINTSALGLDGINIETQDDAGKAITAVEAALKKVIDGRATLGAMQNRLGFKLNNLKNQALNLSEAESRIRDADIAEEMMNFVKASIRTQLATWVISQMNAQASRVLELLKA